jgi:hypothetical protein
MMPDSKEALVTALKEVFNQWEETLASLSEAQIIAPDLPQSWSIQDVIAHLWAWQQISIARTQAVQRQHDPEFPEWPIEINPESEGNVDIVNAWVYENNHTQPWSKVHEKWRNGFLRLIEVAEAVPEEEIFRRGKYPWLGDFDLAAVFQGSYEHHHEHLEELQARMG